MLTGNLNECLGHLHNALFGDELEWTVTLPETEYNNLIDKTVLENILNKITKSISHSNDEFCVENIIIENDEFDSLLEGVYGQVYFK